MPEYSRSDVEHIVRFHELRGMLIAAQSLRDQALLVVLYLTGARISEVLGMKAEDIEVIETEPIYDDEANIIGNTKTVQFFIETKKLRKGKFQITHRKLNFKLHDDNAIYKIIIGQKSKRHTGEKVFQFSHQTAKNIIARLSEEALGIHLCPNNFRHSRMTMEAESGRPLHELMYFKGARSPQSVMPYLHARPVSVDLEKEGCEGRV